MSFMPFPLPPIKHRNAYKLAGRTSKITYFLTEYATSKCLYFFCNMYCTVCHALACLLPLGGRKMSDPIQTDHQLTIFKSGIVFTWTALKPYGLSLSCLVLSSNRYLCLKVLESI